MASTATTPDILENIGLGSGNDFEAEVIVYNCNCHTYQQAIELFCRAIPGMNATKAFELAWRIDHHGRAQVYNGERKLAEKLPLSLLQEDYGLPFGK